jgi:hypothetical protein
MPPMTFALSLEQEDVENVLSCIDGVAEGSESDLAKITLGGLISKIEKQTGIALEKHAPIAVAPEIVAKLREKIAKDVGSEHAHVLDDPKPTRCVSHSLDMFGTTCPRCGEIA